MSKKRDLSKKNFSKVKEKLELDAGNKIEYFKIEDDTFTAISDWYYYAILNLAVLKTNKANPAWVAERLGIDQYIASSALNRLSRLELIKIEKGKMERTTKPLITGTNIPSKVIREYHKNNLKRAEHALENVSIENRQFQSLVLPVDMEKYKTVSKKIDDFMRELTCYLNTDKSTEVYTVSLQIFPNTIVQKGV